MMKQLDNYRTDMKSLLIKVDTRQEERFHRIQRIEKHLERLNGKVAEQEKKITSIWSYGIAAIFVLSIVINLSMRIL